MRAGPMPRQIMTCPVAKAGIRKHNSMISAELPFDPSEVRSHYDELDPFYRELWGEHVHHGFWTTGTESPEIAARRLVELVAEKAQIKSGDLVLDIGCGYGAPAR